MKLANIILLILIVVGSSFLFDISLAQRSAIWSQSAFWFRDNDGTEADASGFGPGNVSENTDITNVPPGTTFRLRFGIKAGAVSGIISPKIEFKEGPGCVAGTWMPITSFTPNFILYPSSDFEDGDPTTQQITSKDFIAGAIFDSTNMGSPLELPKDNFTEYEWSLKMLNDVLFDTEYSFRATNNGEALNVYSKCPNLTVSSAPARKHVFIRPNIVIFEGRAFPGAEVFLVEKLLLEDKLIRRKAEISSIGDFTITDTAVPVGYHTFSLVVRDREGRQAQTKVYNIDFPGEYFAIKDILIPPTIDLVRSVVKKGEFLEIVGYASYLNNVIIGIDNNSTLKARADDKGNYRLLVNTEELSLGRHTIRAKQQDFATKRESDFSTIRTFLIFVSTEKKADFNSDDKIDIEDWSIFLSLWKKENKEDKELIDLNSDGEVNIGDLSIFLQSFKN